MRVRVERSRRCCRWSTRRCRGSTSTRLRRLAVTSTMKVGFIGLGIMGTPMVLNLLAKGSDVMVWNRSKEKCTPLEEKGARVAETPEELAAECDVLIVMVSDPAAALAVAEAACKGLKSGAGYVDMSTVDAATARAVETIVKGAGARYLEAPVSGSKKPAEDGTLIIIAAGDAALYDEMAACFDAMGKKSYLLGESVGVAAQCKLVVNMVMGTMMASLGEGMAIAGGAGMDQIVLLEILGLGAMANPMFALKGGNILKANYATNFPLKHEEKDMRLACELADELGVGAPVASAAREMYRVAREDMALGDEDFSAVVKAVPRQ